MILNIAAFELRQHLRRISTYVYFVVFLVLGALFAGGAAGAIPQAAVEFGTGGKVLASSPYALNSIIGLTTMFGLVITAAIAGQATYKDLASNSAALFYTAPVTRLQYLAGRFLGALATQLAIFSSAGLGAWIGIHLPWVDPTRVGPDIPAAYLQAYVLVVIPNLISTSAIFFGLAALGRKMLPVYAGSVILLIGYFVASELSASLSAGAAAALCDPMGARAIDRLTQYWTPFERNTQLIPLQGIVLLNRALWLGVGAAILALTYWRFRTASPAHASRKPRRVEAGEPPDTQTAPIAPPFVLPVFSTFASLRQLVSLSQIQFVETVKNAVFGVLMLAGWLFAILIAGNFVDPGTTPTYPVTYAVLTATAGAFSVFGFAIITFLSGELVWRERDAQMSQLVDALPVQRWVVFVSKLAALVLVQIVIVAVIMSAGLIVQLIHGYHRFELGLYLQQLGGIVLVRLTLLSVLALLIHTIVDHKYLGHFAMVLYLISSLAMEPLGLQDHLYRYAQLPSFIYSDMNGFGPYARPLLWFELYWGAAALVLAILTSLLWVRGTDASFRVRRKLFVARLSRPSIAALAVGVTAFVGLGAYIFYNTHVLNPYRSTYATQEARAQYEIQYRRYRSVPEPRITDITTEIDLYPESERVTMRGTLTLENKTAAAIDRIAVTVWPVDLAPIPMPHVELGKLRFAGGQTPAIEDPALGFYLYRLATPLPPHGRVALEFAIMYRNVGFVDARPNTDLVENGTSLGERYLPFVGYADDIELTDDSTRHKHGLTGTKRLPRLDDVAARQINAASLDADWITFEGTVSTSPDQIAVMPGYLQRTWQDGGRRYFHYKVDAPILDLLSLNSARYAVLTDRWNDVNLEIYYHPGHEFDLGEMMKSMKASLAYCSAHFGPYQFRQLRILEFPRYQTFAAAYANTVPFSEAIGFITTFDPQKPDTIDLPFYVTAHETAHQWWAHQVIGANVEGQTSIVETLAQYSALMVMKHTYGDRGIKKFLRYELDSYLRGRAQERNEEQPLQRVDVNQGYIHYNKGALVMYAIQDYIGEDAVSEALAGFVKQYAFHGPPYPISLDLIAALKHVTPSQYLYLYEDLWENITLYENRVVAATATRLPQGTYQVRLDLVSHKLRSDGGGQEHAIAEDDWMDVGVLDRTGAYLYLQKHRIERDRTALTITVDGLPARAGIDPLNKLIDRAPDDNVIDLDVQDGRPEAP